MSEQATMQQPSPEEEPAQEQQQQQQKPEQRQQGRDRGRGRGRRHGQKPEQQPQSSAGQPQRRLDPSLNMDELRDLVHLIAEHGFTDFELEREGFRVRLRRELAPQMLQPQAALQPQQGHLAQPATQASTAESKPSTSAQAAGGGGAPQSAPRHPGAEAEAAASEDEGLQIITSPIVGTFYRSPSPTSEPFVRIGSRVEADTVVCIIEAMKLMNEIQAEMAGELVKIYVENGQPVEYGQPLFGIKQ